MAYEHYYPEQQYLGHTLMAEMHPETNTAYIEIVAEFDLNSGLYISTYYEVEDGKEPVPVVHHEYTAAELEAHLAG